MDAAKKMKSKNEPPCKRCPLCKHRFPIVMLRKHLYRTHTKDRNLLELEKLYQKAIKRKSCTEKIASIASLEDPMNSRKSQSQVPTAPAKDEKKRNLLESKGKPDINKQHDYRNKGSSQSAIRYQYGLKKGLLERARMQIKKHSKSVQSSISTVIPLDELPKPKDSLLSLPKPIEDNHIWESRNLRTWDKYYSSYIYPNHHYQLVTMDEVNNLFNPNKKTIVLEKQVTSNAKGEVDPNRKSLIVDEQSSSEAKVNPKEKEVVSDNGKGLIDINVGAKKSPSPKPTVTKSPPPKLISPRSPSPKPEIAVKTLDDLSDMDLHTSEDDEVVEIKVVEKRFGYQPDCEDISSDEEWA